MITKIKETLRKFNLFYFIIATFLIIEALSILFTLGWGFMSSFKEFDDFLVNIIGFPKAFTLENYVNAFDGFFVKIKTASGGFKNVYIENMFVNSILISVGGTLVQTFCTCIMAYVSSKFNFKFCKLIYFIVIVVIALPIVGSLPSEIMVLNSLHLFDNIFAYVFIQRFSFAGTYFLIFYAAFKGIPKDLSEAACVDGASNYKILFGIILPIIKNTFFTIVLLNAITAWNDYQTALIYLPSFPTLAYGLYGFMFLKTSNLVGYPTVQMAGCFIVLMPILLLYIFLNDKFLGNLSMGAVKE